MYLHVGFEGKLADFFNVRRKRQCHGFSTGQRSLQNHSKITSNKTKYYRKGIKTTLKGICQIRHHKALLTDLLIGSEAEFEVLYGGSFIN